jgi:hypothetical protein
MGVLAGHKKPGSEPGFFMASGGRKYKQHKVYANQNCTNGNLLAK